MKKIDLKIILLLVVTVFLIGLIFYTVTLLQDETSSPSSTSSSSLPPVKIKAQSKTYTKTLALNINLSPTPTSFLPRETQILTPTSFSAASPTSAEKIVSEPVFTPTPTEILLAYNITPTEESENENNSDFSTPTARLTIIPESGHINNLLVIFSVAIFIILFSLVF